MVSSALFTCADPETADTWVHALEYFRSQQVDGVIIAGDIADYGLEPQLEVVADAWCRVFPDDKGDNGKHTERLFIYGNHDVQGATWTGVVNTVGADVACQQGIYQHPGEICKQYFYEEYTPICLRQVHGYTFVGAHWHNDNVPGLDEFLVQQQDALRADKPFFYIQHPHLKDTCHGSWA